MVFHRWWKAVIAAARVALYGPIEVEVDPAYMVYQVIQPDVIFHTCCKNYFRIARRRVWQKGCGLLLEKDLEMRRSKVTVNI